jgi:hypothetical protein
VSWLEECGPGARGREWLIGVRGLNLNKIFDLIQIHLNLNEFKTCLSELEKIEIKYGYKGFEIWNIFPYCNFSIFRTSFELKFREDLMSQI